MTKRRDVVAILLKNGYRSVGGTKHEKFERGEITVTVGRHRELSDQTALKLLREARIR